MTVYLDTSSLVKLFLEESGSDQVRALVADATAIATSVVAYAETRAALARRRRERILTPRAFTTAKRSFEGQWPKFAVRSKLMGRGSGKLAILPNDTPWRCFR